MVRMRKFLPLIDELNLPLTLIYEKEFEPQKVLL
jgi:hypothetical protein